MKVSSVALAATLSMGAQPALARPEPPSNADSYPSDAGRDDSGQSNVSGDWSYSSGNDSGGQGSNDAGSSPDVSSPSQGSDSSSETSASSGHAREADPALPPRARPRDPDSRNPELEEAQQRHPRPHAAPRDSGSSGGAPDASALAYDYDSWDGSVWVNPGYSALRGRSSGHVPNDFRDRPRQVGGLRLLVEPRQTAVYVDGSYAGTVEELSGTGRRLAVSRGPHEFALVLDGYRTHRFRVDMAVDHVIDVSHVMDRLEPRRR